MMTREQAKLLFADFLNKNDLEDELVADILCEILGAIIGYNSKNIDAAIMGTKIAFNQIKHHAEFAVMSKVEKSKSGAN